MKTMEAPIMKTGTIVMMDTRGNQAPMQWLGSKMECLLMVSLRTSTTSSPM